MLKRYVVLLAILSSLMQANIHHYDDSEYIDEINQGELEDSYEEAIMDDEYRGSTIRYNHSGNHQRSPQPQHREQPKRYIMQNGVVKFSDETHLRNINKDEFDETNELTQQLSIPYGVPIKVVVDIASQRMNIYADGKRYYRWKVSTGTWKYPTPRGYYRPQYLIKMHYSKKYDDAPMPHSVFFRGGYAIHGTTSTSRLGRRASHGCIRLHPSNAKKLFGIIKNHGKHNVSIVVK